MEKQITKLKCEDVVFFTDWDADELSEDDIDLHYKSYNKDPETWIDKVKLWPNGISYHEKQCNIFEISLTIKLGKAFQYLKNLQFDHCIIMEDDAVLCDDFDEKFKDFLSKTPNDWDAIYFGECVGLHLPTHENKVAYLKAPPSSRGCLGMVFKKKTIDDLASTWFPFNLVSDWEIAYQHFKHKHLVYWWEPTLAKQGSETGIFKSSLRNFPELTDDINYITYCNEAFANITKNMILSFIENVCSGPMTVFCSNEKVKDEIDRFITNTETYGKKIQVKVTQSDFSEKANDYYSEDFIKISQHKFKLILDNIQKYPNIYFIDSDIVFLKDPVYHIKKIDDHDIIFQIDNPINNPINTANWVCSGNFFIKNNSRSEHFLKEVIASYTPQTNDQDCVKKILTKYGENPSYYPHAKIGTFDPRKIQNGCDAFRFKWCELPEAIMVHANWIIGLNDKINTLKNNNLWFYV